MRQRAQRHHSVAVGCGTLLLLALGAPARALEQIVVPFPLLDTSFTLQLADLRQSEPLLSGHGDLAELDQATNGAVGRKLVNLMNTPLPLEVKRFADTSVGSPLLNEALMLLATLFQVQGVPQQLDSQELAAVLD